MLRTQELGVVQVEALDTQEDMKVIKNRWRELVVLISDLMTLSLRATHRFALHGSVYTSKCSKDRNRHQLTFHLCHHKYFYGGTSSKKIDVPTPLLCHIGHNGCC